MEVDDTGGTADDPGQWPQRKADSVRGRRRSPRCFGTVIPLLAVVVAAALSLSHPHGTDAAFTVRVTTPPFEVVGPSPTASASPSPSATPSAQPSAAPDADPGGEPDGGEDTAPDQGRQDGFDESGEQSDEPGDPDRRPDEPGHPDRPGLESPGPGPHASTGPPR